MAHAAIPLQPRATRQLSWDKMVTAAPAASAAALQQHYDEIIAQMPLLPFACGPPALVDLLRGSGKAAAGAAAGRCQICSRSATLALVCTTATCDFAARTVQPTAAHLACGVCRAVSSPQLLLQLALPGPSLDPSRSDALHAIFLHLASVNGAPAAVTSSREGLALWVQELACRAHSLRALAGSLAGWRLLGPDGQQVQTAGVRRLLRQLAQQAQAADRAAAGKQAAGAAAEQQQPQQPSAKKKKKQKQAEQAERVQPPPQQLQEQEQEGKQRAATKTTKTPKKRRSVSGSTPGAADASGKKRSKQERQGAVAAPRQLKTPQPAKKQTKQKRRLSDPS